MAIANQLTSEKKQAPAKFSSFITSPLVKNRINEMVGGKNSQTFITSIISAVSTNPQLQACDSNSILSAALLGESLKLSPSPQLGHYYIVPYGNKGQFQLGYKGMIQLAIRSGQYKKLNVFAIKDGELVNYNALTEEIQVNLIEDEEEREKTKTIGYYAMFEYLNGFRKTLYWSKAKMEAHANRYSKGYAARKGYTFWEKDFDSMAFKTMLRQLLSKWGIMSIDLQKAYENDMAVIDDQGHPSYVDNPPEELPPLIPDVAEKPKQVVEEIDFTADPDFDPMQ